MPQFSVPTRESVSANNQMLFDNLQKSLGFVPNLYATMFKSILLFVMLALFSTGAFAQQETKAIDPVFSTPAGAIKGYDPVAYFTDGKPVEGLASISLEWQGATWHFASVEHRTLFQQNPEKYAPIYGGYCAYGWAFGHDAPTEPDAWSIVDNKLYLNYNKEVQVLWEKERDASIKKADENWQNAVKTQK